MKTFSDLEWSSHPAMPGIIAKLIFPNGFGVSVIKTIYSYGGDEGLYEIAVLYANGVLCYDSGITTDVIGHQSPDDVSSVMKQVQNLKPVVKYLN